jgi:hypothetical protein
MSVRVFFAVLVMTYSTQFIIHLIQILQVEIITAGRK